ncbi:MAG: general secretion pathway protein GspB [Steroidobacteraceae bacterium]
MSFILDALKKSERERELHQTPSAVEITYGRQPRGKPWWLWLVIGLLVFNCVLLSVLWLRSSNTPVPVEVSETTSSASSVSTATTLVTPPIPASSREMRELQDEASDPADPQDPTSVLLSAATLPEGTPLVSAAPLTATEQGIKNYPGNTESGLTPTLDGVGGSAAMNLPDIRLDLHVYSSDKTKRFVFINSNKYTEGQTMSEGPQVEQITNGGVVLSYRGQRFLLPRR